MLSKNPVRLTPEDRLVLEARVRSRTGRADEARRARVVLMLAEGETYDGIQEAVGCGRAYISRWRERFLEQGVAGMYARHKGRKPTAMTPRMQARILARTQGEPADGSTHWSTRKLGKELGVSHMLVQRVWSRAGIKPHRTKSYMVSDDPDFERKAADVIGLYLNPPQHAAVFSLDEKTQVQALDRLDPVLPLSPGRLERHGFEYYRHGTLSLYAALNTKTGEVLGAPVDQHNSAAFVAFLESLLASVRRNKEVHVILDNLSVHKSRLVQRFLGDHPRLHFHFTPTYSSWLNQVEIWFSKIERDVIARGVFTSVKDLARKLMRYIKRYNREAKPIKWRYSDPSHRINGSTLAVTGN
ncbi:MAG: IS630 family transposase [Thermoplasmata archaeon]|nr:IS630 family transposase [Thermoplasmata archaeon]